VDPSEFADFCARMISRYGDAIGISSAVKDPTPFAMVPACAP
jgi:hypothetical protein